MKAVGMKQTKAPSNDIRSNKNAYINNNGIHIDRNRNSTTNTVDDIVEILSMFAKCLGLCIELLDLTKHYVAYCHNIHQLCVHEFN